MIEFDPTDPLGADLWLEDDLDAGMRMTSGLTLLRQAVFHRLQTPRGRLIDDEDYGLDVRALLHRAMTPTEVAAAQSQIASELRKEDRLAVGPLTVTLVRTEGERWRITIQATVDGAPFRMVVAAPAAGELVLEEAS